MPHEEHASTLLYRSQQRNHRKPHQQERCTPPTYLLCFLKSVCQAVHVDQHQREVSTLSSRGQDTTAAPIRSITERPSLSPSSFSRRLIGFSCESLSLAGRRRAYHVPPLLPCGLGRVFPPVAHRLRWRSSEPPDLATYLLVQACQHLALVLCDDGYDASPELTLPHDPGSRPPRCWQSQLDLTGELPSWRMRLRCSESFAPRVTHVPVGYCGQHRR